MGHLWVETTPSTFHLDNTIEISCSFSDSHHANWDPSILGSNKQNRIANPHVRENDAGKNTIPQTREIQKKKQPFEGKLYQKDSSRLKIMKVATSSGHPINLSYRSPIRTSPGEGHNVYN